MAAGRAPIFAGGDVTGTRYAAEAIGAGKRAAAAVHAHLQGRDPAAALAPARLGYSPNLSMRYFARPDSYHSGLRVNLQRVVRYDEIERLYFDPQPRAGRRHPSAALSLSEEEALAEARRCFNCGTCIGCDNCLLFCPDMAISRRDDGLGFEVNWDYCKGCGAYAAECPREALVLEEEVK